MEDSDEPETGWTVADIAHVYGEPVATIETLRSRDGGFPKPIGRRGRAFVYGQADVKSWAGKRGWRPQSDSDIGDENSGLGRLPDLLTAVLAALGCLHAQGRLDASDIDPARALADLVASEGPWAAQLAISTISPILEQALGFASPAEVITSDALDPQGPMTAWRDACDLVVGRSPHAQPTQRFRWDR